MLSRLDPQLLYNGDFELDTPTFFYYDNNTGNTGTALDVPGWEAFANADPSSWVQVSEDTPTVPGDWVLNLSGSDVTGPGFVGLAGIKTAVANRPAVTPGLLYHATVTYDNYFAPAGISYFIDWFGGGGTPLGSTGGLLADPNGPLGFDPHNQLLQIVGAAPAGAATAGVRFESANGGFAGATADNFHFGLFQNQVRQPWRYWAVWRFSASAAAAIAAKVAAGRTCDACTRRLTVT